jgi:hypothetical protein
MSLCNCLQGFKILSGYSANISRFVNMKTLKVRYKKLHDCYMLIVKLLDVAIRGILPENVRDTIIKFCSFST